MQLTLLLLTMMAEPISSTVILPFVNQLVRETGVTGGDERKTGYFAGLIESLFYVTEAVCILQWGRASDRIGRKPILLGGLLGQTLSMVGFGFSRRYWALILSRCAQGLLNGNIGVTKSAMAEITDETNRARGFAFIHLIWTVGGTIGPIVGGVLARPADRWRRAMHPFAFWKVYPYFLPCITVASLIMCTFVLSTLGLKETLKPRSRLSKERPAEIMPSQVHAEPDTADVERSTPVIQEVTRSWTPNRTYPRVEDKDEKTPNDEVIEAVSQVDEDAYAQPGLRSILVPRVLLVMLNFGFLAFTDQAIVVLVPLMYSTNISAGGLGMDSFTIGVIQGVAGFMGGVLQIVTLPWMERRFGTKRLYTASYACFIVVFAAFPLMAFLARRSGEVGVGTWVVIVVQFVAYALASMTWGCIFIYITDAAPNERALGLTNGLGQTTVSTVCAVAPSAASSLFAASLEGNIAGGTLVYWVFCGVVVMGIASTRWLPVQLRSQ
ncbi:MFS general substrate transporter [Trametes versicolor FP-101664 SS1]|uniref:MFS general substrate transporter n=1 Tax=Trametes versicolor (strain FP-101664) TaxID=717944 RepID=UPI0004622444|nr:MFS general substrate transporter [Trametes versicolor FP-101664 SS1]EIW57758.1 MFS general substrate transporter [Trametes versicolor FP-101664 SS1]